MFPAVNLFIPLFYLFERNWSLTLYVSHSRCHTYYLTGLALIYNQLGLTCYAYVRYRLFCFCYLEWGSKYTCFIFMKEEFKWRTMNTGNVKSNQRLKHWANDYPRFWPKRGCWQSKQNNVIERNRSQQSPSLGDPRSGSNAIYSRRNLVCCEQKQAADRAEIDRWMVWLSTDSRYSKAAVTLFQKGILVQRKRVPCRWAVSFPDENVFTTDGKGICRNSWRKRTRCPRRLRVPSLNKIAQTAVRPSPLWEFRAANCFRDLIA